MPVECEPLTFNLERVELIQTKQTTFQRSVSAQGIGLFSGEEISIRLVPAKSGTGIVFQRVDLPHRPCLPARLEYVQGTPRCTLLGRGEDTVQTVEHLLAALRGCHIDNALIEISGGEVPIFDGSSKVFVDLIEQAGRCEQQELKEILRLKKPIFWSEGSIQLIALPSSECRLSYTLHYPHCEVIGTQFYSLPLTSESFKKEIASCRTFSIYEEIVPMIEKGLVKGGSLDRSVLIKAGAIANPEGLRYPDEMVRHKILDLIGDLSLIPPFQAHVIAICSGHTSNNAFAKQFLNYVKVETL